MPSTIENETQPKSQEINEMKTADEKSTTKEKDELPTAIIIRVIYYFFNGIIFSIFKGCT
jgi:hypothetical protein